MKCPECGKQMVDKGWNRLYFKCECGHGFGMSIDEYWKWLENQHRLYGNPQIPKTAQNAEIPPKSDNTTLKS